MIVALWLWTLSLAWCDILLEKHIYKYYAYHLSYTMPQLLYNGYAGRDIFSSREAALEHLKEVRLASSPIVFQR